MLKGVRNNSIFPKTYKYILWLSRRSYLQLIDGIPVEYNNHIVKYLFNELVAREVCELIH